MRTRARGFLLLETLLTVLILTVGLTLVVRSFSGSIASMGISHDYTRAMLLLEEKMWELEVAGAITPGLSSGRFEDADHIVAFRWELLASSCTPLDLCETTLTVSWTRGGRSRAVSVVTYLKRQVELS